MTVLLSGLALGAVYALVGVAVGIVAAAARTLLLAVGPILVAGVLVHLVLSVEVATGLPPVVALVAGLVVGALLAALLEPLVLARLPAGAPWLLGMAVAAVVVEAGVARLLGTTTYRPDPVVGIGPVGPVAGPVVGALVVGLPAAGLLAVALERTRWGRRVRLVGGSVRAAVRSGISPGLVRAGALAVGGAAAVGAGLLAAPVAFVGVAQSTALTVRGLAAALLLGRRRPGWAIPGGLLVGLAEAAGQALSPRVGGELAVAALVVVVLAARGTAPDRPWRARTAGPA